MIRSLERLFTARDGSCNFVWGPHCINVYLIGHVVIELRNRFFLTVLVVNLCIYILHVQSKWFSFHLCPTLELPLIILLYMLFVWIFSFHPWQWGCKHTSIQYLSFRHHIIHVKKQEGKSKRGRTTKTSIKCNKKLNAG